METPQPDKTGMHILLKLASLVVILAGIHAAADIIVQLLLALFFLLHHDEVPSEIRWMQQ